MGTSNGNTNTPSRPAHGIGLGFNDNDNGFDSPLPPPPNMDLLVPDPVMIPLPPPVPAAAAPVITPAAPVGYTTVDAALRQGVIDPNQSDGNQALLSAPLPTATQGAAVTAVTMREPSTAAIAGLKDQSQELRLLLEQEIRTLENIVTTREIGSWDDCWHDCWDDC